MQLLLAGSRVAMLMRSASTLKYWHCLRIFQSTRTSKLVMSMRLFGIAWDGLLRVRETRTQLAISNHHRECAAIRNLTRGYKTARLSTWRQYGGYWEILIRAWAQG